jgi:Na+/glutamate symporter
MMWLLYVVDAGLLVTSGLIHLHLWDIAYRNVGTLDVLFLVQTALCLLLASFWPGPWGYSAST